MVVAGPAHGDVYRDGWRREEVLAELQGRFSELVEPLGGAQQWPQRMMLFDTERQGARVGPWSECRSYCSYARRVSARRPTLTAQQPNCRTLRT